MYHLSREFNIYNTASVCVLCLCAFFYTFKSAELLELGFFYI